MRVLIADDHSLFAKTLEALLAGLTKDPVVDGALPALLAAAEAPARLSSDGSAELAGRARVG